MNKWFHTAVAAGFERNMNSEEDGNGCGRSKGARVKDLAKGDKQLEQGDRTVQSRMCAEQLIAGGNIGDGRSGLPLKMPVALSNGTRSLQATTSNCVNSVDGGQDSLGMSSGSVKAQASCVNSVSQVKHKTVVNAAKTHLNVSSGQTHQNCAPCSSASVSSCSLYLASTSNTSAIAQNLCTSRSSEDVDMKNNVDYVSGIEKCPSKVSCSSDSSPEADAWAAKSYRSECVLNNIGGSIGSTSQGTCCFLRPNINGNKEAPGPSGLQRCSQRESVERRDSSSGNEGDMSDGEDCCIYTYKGNDAANHLGQNEEPNQGQAEEHELEGQHQSGRSSPEMDFLEMDFDPGPSCEQDTGDSDLASINEEIQNIALDNVEPDPMLNDLSSGKVVSRQGIASQHPKQTAQNVGHVALQQCTSNPSKSEQDVKPSYPSPWIPSTSSGAGKWDPSSLHRTTKCPLRESYGYHNTSGDLISPSDNKDSDPELWGESSSASVPENASFSSRKVNLSSTLYHRTMAKKLMLNKQTAFNQSGDSNLESELRSERLDGLIPIEKVMLWSEQEATVKQVTQIGTSACGATAAINALLALNVSFSLEMLVKGVATRLREVGAPLPKYLQSRSLAGSTHKDIARGISLATNGTVVTKFFAFYPERKVSLSHWLHYWISRRAAPIATLNLQHCGEGSDIPDAWHHQMIFGVGQAGIYLTNPLECLPEQFVWHQLVSPSVLLVRRADVLAHWNENTDLTPLASMDQRWRKLNVLGQVVNMVREAMSQRQQPNATSTSTTHIRIPASYQAGITLVMSADSAAATELLHTEQLPLL